MISRIDARSIDGLVLPECYVISSGGTWLPGSFASERAARYAFRFSHRDLERVQQSVNPDGVITFKMLQELRRCG